MHQINNPQTTTSSQKYTSEHQPYMNIQSCIKSHPTRKHVFYTVTPKAAPIRMKPRLHYANFPCNNTQKTQKSTQKKSIMPGRHLLSFDAESRVMSHYEPDSVSYTYDVIYISIRGHLHIICIRCLVYTLQSSNLLHCGVK